MRDDGPQVRALDVSNRAANDEGIFPVAETAQPLCIEDMRGFSPRSGVVIARLTRHADRIANWIVIAIVAAVAVMFVL